MSSFKALKETVSKKEFIFAVIAFLLMSVSLYQLEIVYIDMTLNRPFCFPFFIYCTYDYAMVRDFWYAMIYLAFFLLAYAIWKWE